MLKRERQSFILRQVNLHKKVLSSDLSQEMKVSEDTIRRDLNELSENGKIIKVHGGALSKSFHRSALSLSLSLSRWRGTAGMLAGERAERGKGLEQGELLGGLGGARV